MPHGDILCTALITRINGLLYAKQVADLLLR